MSIMDLKLELSDAQSILQTAADTSTVSTNVLDLGAADLAIGAGTPLYLSVRVAEVFAGPATGSVTFKLQEGIVAACTGDTYLERTMLNTALTAGKWVMRVPIPYEQTKRYLKLYTINSSAVTAFTTGKIDAWVSGATPETNVGT